MASERFNGYFVVHSIRRRLPLPDWFYRVILTRDLYWNYVEKFTYISHLEIASERVLKWLMIGERLYMNKNTGKFEQGLNDLGISLENTQLEKFIMFYDMLIEKNKVMNLTGITEWEDVVLKHFLDSLALVKCVNLNEVNTLIDVGTGAGFPGIPLKIAFPHLQITLMDSLNKRIKFLQEIIDVCGLQNIEAVHSRAEDLARKREYRENFDICVSRAVANLNTLSEYCVPFVKEGGKFISYKSGTVEDEVKGAEKAIKILGGKINDLIKFELPESNISRALVVIDKVKCCNRKYPRKPAAMKENPL